MIRPVWAYGAQIWGCAKPTQIKSIQSFQSISLRQITSAPWFVSNHSLHKDLNIESVENLTIAHYKKFHSTLSLHSNPLVSNQYSFSLPNDPPRRLKRRWCRDLLIQALYPKYNFKKRVLSLDGFPYHVFLCCLCSLQIC